MNCTTTISQVVQDCYSVLEDGFYSGSLLARLYSKTCITAEEKEQVDVCATNFAKSRLLLDILRTKPDSVLDVLLEFFHTDGTQKHFEKLIYDSACKFGHYGTPSQGEGSTQAKRRKTQILSQKWWPEHKEMIKTFVNRTAQNGKSLVENLRAELLSGDTKTAAIIAKKHAIVGMGGIGKTSTAKWYANTYQDEYDQIIWVDSEGPSLSNSFTQLARDFGLVRDENKGAHSVKELGCLIYKKLEDVTCLFVFDNAERFDGEAGLKHLLPRCELHHSIITSRNQDWGNPNEFGRISTFQLDVFSRTECISLVSNALGLAGRAGSAPAKESDILALGHELGFLPLALQCAVATIMKSKRYTVASYLARIRQDLQMLVDKKILNEYERSISATLSLSMEQIEQDEEIDVTCRELCKAILNVAAYCEPTEIPEGLFLAAPAATKDNVGDAVDQLVVYSLVTMESGDFDDLFDEPIQERKFGIHRLMQHVIRHKVMLDSNATSATTQTLDLVFACLRTDLGRFETHATHAWTVAAQQFGETMLTSYRALPYEISVAHGNAVAPNFIKDALQTMTNKGFNESNLTMLQLRMRLIEILLEKHRTTEATVLCDELEQGLNAAATADANGLPFGPQLGLQLRILSLSIQEDMVTNPPQKPQILMLTREEMIQQYEQILRDLDATDFDGRIRDLQFYHPTWPNKGLSLKLVLVLRYGLCLFAAGQLDKAIEVIRNGLTKCEIDLSSVVKVEAVLLQGRKQYSKLLFGLVPTIYELMRKHTNAISTHPEAMETFSRAVQIYGNWLRKHERPLADSLEVLSVLAQVEWKPKWKPEKGGAGLPTLQAFTVICNKLLRSPSAWTQSELVLAIIKVLDDVWNRLTISVKVCTDRKELHDREVYWTWLLELTTTYSYAQLVTGNVDHVLDLDTHTLMLLQAESGKIDWTTLYNMRSFVIGTFGTSKCGNILRTAVVRGITPSNRQQILQSKLNLVMKLIESSLASDKNKKHRLEISEINSYDEACYLCVCLNQVEAATELWGRGLRRIAESAGPGHVARVGRQTLELLEEMGLTMTETVIAFMSPLSECVEAMIKRHRSFNCYNHTRWLVQLIARLLRYGHHQTAVHLTSVVRYANPHSGTDDAWRFGRMKALLRELSDWSKSASMNCQRKDDAEGARLESEKDQLLLKLSQVQKRRVATGRDREWGNNDDGSSTSSNG